MGGPDSKNINWSEDLCRYVRKWEKELVRRDSTKWLPLDWSTARNVELLQTLIGTIFCSKPKAVQNNFELNSVDGSRLDILLERAWFRKSGGEWKAINIFNASSLCFKDLLSTKTRGQSLIKYLLR